MAAGATISPAVTVSVLDAYGNAVAGASVELSLVGTRHPDRWSAPWRRTRRGIATFASLSVDLAGAKQLSATSGALTPAVSDTFEVTAGAAATLAFVQQPTHGGGRRRRSARRSRSASRTPTATLSPAPRSS